VIDGTVTKLVNFGAFVRIEEGLEGLIHISELSNSRVAHPGDVVQEGQQLKLKIISLDSERHRLGLSLKQTEDRSTPQVQPSYELTEPGEGDGRDRTARPERERAERGPRRDRRDRRDRGYDPEDATAEPEEGIDNTMAAAFAESGLLDQFRTEEPAPEKAAEPAAEPAPEPAPEPAEAPAEPEAAEPAEPAAAEAGTAEPVAEPVAEAAADAAPESEAAAEPAPKPRKRATKAAKTEEPKDEAADAPADAAPETESAES
jgi:predicted RNA-binding protein with RPS1 domain